MTEPARRRTRRNEGEVTSWPRGLVDYTTKGPADATPEPEEDRTLNRIRLAGRLLTLLRSQGHEERDLLDELRTVERGFAAGDRRDAARRIEPLLARIDRALTEANRPDRETGRRPARTP